MEYGMIFTVFLLLGMKLLQTESQSVPQTPCPDIFTYEQDRNGWYGLIKVPNPYPVDKLELKVQIYYTELKQQEKEGNLDLINPLDQEWKHIKTGEKYSIQHRLTFPLQSPLPKVGGIILNDKIICKGNEPDSPEKQSYLFVHTINNHKCKGDNCVECGTVAVQPIPLIHHGSNTVKGQFPWHIALYRSTIDLKYLCGGSLIGPQTVVTAAHCVTVGNRPSHPSLFLVYLGKYNLSQWNEEHVQSRQVQTILVHPSFNRTRLYSDIAIIILSSPVQYTTYVKPICLWQEDKTDLSEIVGKNGIVAGWGLDENGALTKDLKMTKLPVVSQETCQNSDQEFYRHFTSEKTFCAGFGNETNVCNGDSGGGMIFPKRTQDGRTFWMLRGIVSLSRSKDTQYICDPIHFVVFTDTAKFINWIESNSS